MRLYRNIKGLLLKRGIWDLFTYIFFGALTTLVNVVVFSMSTSVGLSWVFANFIAWILSVLFAFLTNKIWVFHSKTRGPRAFIWEFFKFVFARIVSLGIDYGFMVIFINLLHTGDFIAKLLTQFAIVFANYFFSKFLIFKK
ncbi:GtrA family protein [Lacticaseibacillus paracasei]|nr:GtrA family protein [Lacticaseibacillus paracasei]